MVPVDQRCFLGVQMKTLSPYGSLPSQKDPIDSTHNLRRPVRSGYIHHNQASMHLLHLLHLLLFNDGVQGRVASFS